LQGDVSAVVPRGVEDGLQLQGHGDVSKKFQRMVTNLNCKDAIPHPRPPEGYRGNLV
jgi:hypothetical protein